MNEHGLLLHTAGRTGSQPCQLQRDYTPLTWKWMAPPVCKGTWSFFRGQTIHFHDYFRERKDWGYIRSHKASGFASSSASLHLTPGCLEICAERDPKRRDSTVCMLKGGQDVFASVKPNGDQRSPRYARSVYSRGSGHDQSKCQSVD